MPVAGVGVAGQLISVTSGFMRPFPGAGGPTAPSTPAAPVATGADASASVTWTAPANGGSALTSYTVTPFIGAAAQTTKVVSGSPPATSTTVTGLTNGTAYTFKVRATNAVGSSADSAASNAVTPVAAVATLPVTAGCIGWWDATDAATFTFSSGVVVSQWADKSGGNKHATQGTVAYQPTRVASAINTNPGVLFNGKALSIALTADAKPVHLFAVLKLAGSLPGTGYILGTQSGANSYLSWDMEPNKHRILRAGVALIGETTATYAANAANAMNVSYAANGAWAWYRDGVADGSGTNDQPLASGTTHVIGAQSPTGFASFNGHIGEMIRYDRVLTTGERQQVETYLRTKWGTP